ncbi:MAG: adenosylcobinamide-GDP ribazoletransferase [Thermodesulfovibrionia bacterium]
MIKRVLLAFQFLTIIPFRDVGVCTEKELGSATTFFPLIGLIEGILFAIASIPLLRLLPSEIATAFIVLLIVVMNGGLHLDGLADTFDAIASRGNKDKKLAIMKDSSIGPIGVVSIVIAILFNYLMLNAILNAREDIHAITLIIMPLATRWAMVCAIYYSRPAKNEGLGRLFIEHTGNREFITATAMTIGFVLLVSALTSHINHFLFFCVIAFPILYIVSIIAVWSLNRQFNGLTGDSFGAINEIQRVIFLLITVIWSRHYIS